MLFRREHKVEGPLRLPQEMIEARLEKIRKYCRMARRVVLVMIWYCVLVCILTFLITVSLSDYLVGSIAEKGFPSNMLFGLDVTATAAISMVTAKRAMFGYFLIGTVGMIFGIWAYNLLQETLKDIANGATPFSITYVKRVRKIGLIFILMEPASALLCVILYAIVGAAISSQAIFMLFVLPLSSIFIGGLVLCLAGIFEYGCLLQAEYDDTV